MTQVTGGCLCGAVRITATGDPYRVGLCHCLDCRKHHGALFHASAIFPEAAVTVTGETRHYSGRHFCPACEPPVGRALIGAPSPLEGLLCVMRDFRFRRPVATAQGARRSTACVRPAARRAPGG